MRQLSIARFPSCTARRPERLSVSWPELRELLTTHSVLPRKEAGGLWSPTEYPDPAELAHVEPEARFALCARASGNVRSLSCLVLDFDRGHPYEWLKPEWQRWEYVVHSTHSHTRQQPRWRAIFPLARDVGPDEWRLFREVAAERVGQAQADPSCKDLARLYFLPSCPPEHQDAAFAEGHSGAWLDLEEFREAAEQLRERRARRPAAAPAGQSGRGGGRPKPPGSGDYTTLRVAAWFSAHGLYGWDMGEGKHAVACPWEHEHTEQKADPAADTDTAVWENGPDQWPGFRCLHAHCADRDMRAVMERLGDADAYCDREWRPPADRNGAADRPPHPADGEADGGGSSAAHVPRNLTDLGNAERLVDRHGADLRYCHEHGAWYAWDARRWARDATGEIVRRAKETGRSIYAEAALVEGDHEKGRRREIAAWARKTESRDRIGAMIDLARSETGIPVRSEALDTDPWLLCCANGTLDLRTGELRPHSRADLITRLCPVPYDPAAECPEFMAFLNRIMAGNTRLIAFIQRAIGYSLTGSIRERAVFICYGAGANGKTTLLEIIQTLLDDYALRTPTETLLLRQNGGGIPNDLARLKGARFVFASEVEEGRRLAVSLVKDLAGGDTISARFMRAEWFQFRPECKLWLATNHRPVIRDTNRAIWDRVKLIPFTVSIPPHERDRALPEKLRAELPGILAWAVRGCREWLASGLAEPEEVADATESYRTEQDPLAPFLADCCETGPDHRCYAAPLYTTYREWCDRSGERPLTQQTFGTKLSEKGFERRRGTGGKAVWIGLSLRPEADDMTGLFTGREAPPQPPDEAPRVGHFAGQSDPPEPPAAPEEAKQNLKVGHFARQSDPPVTHFACVVTHSDPDSGINGLRETHEGVIPEKWVTVGHWVTNVSNLTTAEDPPEDPESDPDSAFDSDPWETDPAPFTDPPPAPPETVPETSDDTAVAGREAWAI